MTTPGALTDEALDRHARALSAKLDWCSLHRSNETELREDVDPIIREAARELFGLDDLSVTAERDSGESGPRRPYDKLFGGLVVEWEWQMGSARRAHGASQALEYLGRMRSRIGTESIFTAVVCDGRQWGFLTTDLDQGQLDLFEVSDLPPEQRFEWRPNSPASCRRFLTLIGSNKQKPVTARGLASAFGPHSQSARVLVTLLSEALLARGEKDRADTLYREWRRSLEVVYGNLDDESGVMASELRTAFELSEAGTLGELLFVVHTYFALVVRVVAIEILSVSMAQHESQPTHWSSHDDEALAAQLRAIDAGVVPSGLSIQNLFEGDVFSWYVSVLRGNADLCNAIRDLLDELSGFALPRVAYGANPATDVLRDLYQCLVPRRLRKALGEFLTPSWLAEACLDRLKGLGASVADGRVLDPTCGTGTFLLPILRDRVGRLRAKHGEDITAEHVQELLNHVAGFDINPVAVTAARVNMLVALGDLAVCGALTLPIWRADSLLLPEPPELQITTDYPRLVGHEWYELRTSLNRPFPIPPALATRERLAELRRLLEDALVEDDDQRAAEAFYRGCESAFSSNPDAMLNLEPEEWEDAWPVCEELLDRILHLRAADRDGVWPRIVENAFAPLFGGACDVVVGNPPWLTWAKMPAEWRAAGEKLWRKYGLWKVPAEPGRRTRTHPSGDIAILVFATALERYASSGAFVGLLVPKSLMNADPGGRAFRRFHLETSDEDANSLGLRVDLPFRLVHADDWSGVKPFAPDAANSPVFLVARPAHQHESPVPGIVWHRTTARTVLSDTWSVTRQMLRQDAGTYQPVDPSAPTSAWSYRSEDDTEMIHGGTNPWSFGTGLHTRGANGIFFVRVLEVDRANSRALVENIPAAGRNPAIPTRRMWVDSSLVHPLLRGRQTSQWLADAKDYIVLAYGAADPYALLAETELSRDYPDTLRWLRQFRRWLIRRKAPPTGGWDLDGPDWYRVQGPMEHMLGASFAVVVREQQHRPAAAVIAPAYDDSLGRTVIPAIDHKLAFTAIDEEDEAHYLCAVINSSPMQDLLASFASDIAVSPQTIARLPVPPFDASDSRKMGIARLGKQAQDLVKSGEIDRLPELSTELGGLVTSLLI